MRLSGSNGPTFDVQHDVSGNDGRGGVQDLFAGKRDTQLNRPSRERGGYEGGANGKRHTWPRRQAMVSCYARWLKCFLCSRKHPRVHSHGPGELAAGSSHSVTPDCSWDLADVLGKERHLLSRVEILFA